MKAFPSVSGLNNKYALLVHFSPVPSNDDHDYGDGGALCKMSSRSLLLATT
jgi:hypothetical protein